jgi:nucleotide-binding universal stress UspA family protein
MAVKNILLLVHDDAGQEARLQVALDLTRALSGHLNCLDAVQMPVMVDSYAGTGLSILLEEEQDRESENKARTQPRLATEGISWSWTDATGDLADCVVDAARTADVIVLNRSLDAFPAPDMRYVATEVLKHSRALVVAVSDSIRAFDAAGKALIAWDGSERAMATVQRAVPLLSLASDVKLLQVGKIGEYAIPAEDAATYLSRHGIAAEVQLAPEADSIAVAIRQEADRFGAAYLVMGAYNHRPAREAIFGGVTRAMLSACSLPLVLGH